MSCQSSLLGSCNAAEQASPKVRNGPPMNATQNTLDFNGYVDGQGILEFVVPAHVE